MIYTVTLNPSLDYLVRTDALRPGRAVPHAGGSAASGRKGRHCFADVRSARPAHARARLYRGTHGRAVRPRCSLKPGWNTISAVWKRA